MAKRQMNTNQQAPYHEEKRSMEMANRLITDK